MEGAARRCRGLQVELLLLLGVLSEGGCRVGLRLGEHGRRTCLHVCVLAKVHVF